MPQMMIYLDEERDEKIEKIKHLLRHKNKQESIWYLIDKATIPEPQVTPEIEVPVSAEDANASEPTQEKEE